MHQKTRANCFRRHALFLVAGLVGLSLILVCPPGYGQTQKTLVDLNTASEKELESLKGVGPATAKKIMAGRPYTSVEDLKKAGISDKMIQSMKPYVKVGAVSASPKPAEVRPTTPPVPAKKMSKEAPAKVESAKEVPAVKSPPKAAAPVKLAPGQKVNINKATKEQLEALPGIGPAKAQAIIDGRPYKNTEDVMKVKGIKGGTFGKIKDMISVN
ncbi:MAG: helix-hairpin-helix domain-containing protein [Syntrophorhabdaceae bacterium]|nr:helix-hairpin-helix domain-containing protein [Syntrophorhabdaceae bacterium]